MYSTTEAIVLQLHPYKDKSAVAKLYTERIGLISCWVNSVHSRKTKTKAAILQPLSIINAELSYQENNNLPQLKEINLAAATPNISLAIEKSSIALFLSELLLRCIKEASPEAPLYSFIKQSIMLLDNTIEKCSNFHILFLVRLSEYFGFLPQGNFSEATPYFNLEEGVYQERVPRHPRFLQPREGQCLAKLLNLSMEQFGVPVITSASRKALLRGLLEYYEIHLGIQPLKSHLVLEDVF